MDVIIASAGRLDIGVLMSCDIDIDLGEDNTFALTTDLKSEVAPGYFCYIEGTEFGGIIDSVKIETLKERATYSGRTWRGLLGSKIIEPPPGSAYKTVSGDANTVIASMITYCGLSNMFEASGAASGLNISSYSFNRYTDMYSGLRKMLKTVNGKLKLSWNRSTHKVTVSAVPRVEYSDSAEVTSDQMNFVIQKYIRTPNHVIGLGSGNLADREVIHRYVDADGEISETQYYMGDEEWAITLDYPNAESTEELIKSAEDALLSENKPDSIKVNVSDLELDIDDSVTAKEVYTNTMVTAVVVQKIIKISNGYAKIAYKVE